MNSHLRTPSQNSENHPVMVSHPEIPERSRRAPSVSSRTSRSQHHRSGRSHHGGSTYQPQNEFPFFAQTGDVEIVISAEGQEKRYLLHRLILAQCSGFFEAGTSEEWSRSQAIQQIQNSTSRPDQALTRIGEDERTVPSTPILSPEMLSRGTPGGRKWRYELDWENNEEDDDPILVQKVLRQNLFNDTDTNEPRRRVLAACLPPDLLLYNHHHVQSHHLHILEASSVQCWAPNRQPIYRQLAPSTIASPCHS